MHRFVFFVDGSNLYGSIRDMGLAVDDYERFYRYIFEHSVVMWNEANRGSSLPISQLRRVYWYVVGTMDDWDLEDEKALEHLEERFFKDRVLKNSYFQTVGEQAPGLPQSEVAVRAWRQCLEDFRTWYSGKRESLFGMKRFYHAVRTSTDFIDIIECGHWKVDFFNSQLNEKGLDTRLAVDMVALAGNYDVGIVISGDYDNIPSIEYMKTRDKNIGAVEFLRGYPPERRGRSFSSHLKLHADFVVQVYEMDLVRDEIARKMG